MSGTRGGLREDEEEGRRGDNLYEKMGGRRERDGLLTTHLTLATLRTRARGSREGGQKSVQKVRQGEKGGLGERGAGRIDNFE